MKTFILLIISSILLFGCNSGPAPIAYRQEECVFCKMTIMDPKFGCQIKNDKGKVFNFDDLSCLTSYLKGDILDTNHLSGIYVPNYLADGELFAAETAFYVASELLRSPMAGNIAAFSNKDSAIALATKLNGKLASWQNIKAIAHE